MHAQKTLQTGFMWAFKSPDFSRIGSDWVFLKIGSDLVESDWIFFKPSFSGFITDQIGFRVSDFLNIPGTSFYL